MNQLSYHDAWSFLDQLQFFKIKLGLDSMREFLDSLDHPQKEFPVIHIAGTNGKGSVGSTILSVLSESGYKAGFYTSPHLSSVRERFRIGNRYISENEFATEAEKIIQILDGRQITYFEFTTTLAMLWFAKEKVDLAILETGLGGRLDATNVVTPLVSVITNVSMDHEQYLGDTIFSVATEKSGIIKPGIPVITGETENEPLQVIVNTAAGHGNPLYLLGRDFKGSLDSSDKTLWNYEGNLPAPSAKSTSFTGLPLAMKGDYQVDNASIALASLEIIALKFPVEEKYIRSGLKKVTWPGRLEEFWRDDRGNIMRNVEAHTSSFTHFLLDGAHNPAGVTALKKSLENDFEYEHLLLIWASMADKDMDKTLQAIAPLADKIIFTQPEAERSASPEILFRLLPENLQIKATCLQDVNEALQLAVNLSRPGSLICIAGSLYLVGRARRILCGELVNSL